MVHSNGWPLFFSRSNVTRHSEGALPFSLYSDLTYAPAGVATLPICTPPCHCAVRGAPLCPSAICTLLARSASAFALPVYPSRTHRPVCSSSSLRSRQSRRHFLGLSPRKKGISDLRISYRRDQLIASERNARIYRPHKNCLFGKT
jgi:hypothetical protein